MDQNVFSNSHVLIIFALKRTYHFIKCINQNPNSNISACWTARQMMLSGLSLIFKVDLAHPSPITLKRCIQPHGECGRAVRWSSAPGWWCRRCRACHSSCNWGGMPGLTGPFHLRPAVRWEIQKIQELIMSLLGFCLAVWGRITPPWPSSSPAPLHETATHPSPPPSSILPAL